ncbi:MAG: class II aldolase/adducin family protein [Thiohalocapsa sp. PB-PSB1]|nr:MAG: class II aldolase/adducin family protein [Thiohalocapsa sp. PB-PSB1]
MQETGYTKFQVDWMRTPMFHHMLTNELADWRCPLYDAGLIGWDRESGIGFGNLSARLGASRRFVISGTQTGCLRRLGPEHFALVTSVDIAANRVVCHGPIQASSESMTHAELYALDAEIQAIVHVHSAQLWTALQHELPSTATDVAYGTPAMAREFLRLYHETDFPERRIAVMRGHRDGLIAIGESIAEAALRILAYRDGCRPPLTAHQPDSRP